MVSGEITNSGSLNRYCYVQGNPVSLTDPFGLCPNSNSAFKNLCNNLYHMDWNAIGHAALDVAGIFFDGADVINAIWYACEGNMEMAAASAVCAIPALGMATGNLLMKSNKLAAAGKAVKAIAKMTQGVMGVCAGIEMAKAGFTNFLNGLEAGTFDAGALLQTLGGIGIAMLSGKGLASSGRELLACEEGLSQLWNSAKSKVSKGIRDFANDNRGFVDLDALGLVKSNANQKPIGWHVGDPIDNLTRTGAEPSWSTVRSRYWKNEAYFNPDDYSESNLKLMQKGRAPRDDIYGVSMELHHKEGRNIDNPHNSNNLEPLWPWQHAAKDSNRHYTGPRPQ